MRQRGLIIASIRLLVAARGAYAGAAPACAETDSSRVMRLFLYASEGGVRYRDFVEPAKDSLAQMGADAARWLVHRLDATDARERLTLADIFEKIGPAATPHVVDHLDAPGDYTPRNAARCLGRIGDSSAVPALVRQLDNPWFNVRSQVATALGEIKDPRALDALLSRLPDEGDSDVRKSCVVALGRLGDARAAETLVAYLNDPFFGVRQSALQSLIDLAPCPLALLREAAQGFTPPGQYGAIVALGGCDDQRARSTLLQLLRFEDAMIRGFAVEALALHPEPKSRRAIEKLAASETDPFVIAQIARYRSGE